MDKSPLILDLLPSQMDASQQVSASGDLTAQCADPFGILTPQTAADFEKKPRRHKRKVVLSSIDAAAPNPEHVIVLDNVVSGNTLQANQAQAESQTQDVGQTPTSAPTLATAQAQSQDQAKTPSEAQVESQTQAEVQVQALDQSLSSVQSQAGDNTQAKNTTTSEEKVVGQGDGVEIEFSGLSLWNGGNAASDGVLTGTALHLSAEANSVIQPICPGHLPIEHVPSAQAAVGSKAANPNAAANAGLSAGAGTDAEAKANAEKNAAANETAMTEAGESEPKPKAKAKRKPRKTKKQLEHEQMPLLMGLEPDVDAILMPQKQSEYEQALKAKALANAKLAAELQVEPEEVYNPLEYCAELLAGVDDNLAADTPDLEKLNDLDEAISESASKVTSHRMGRQHLTHKTIPEYWVSTMMPYPMLEIIYRFVTSASSVMPLDIVTALSGVSSIEELTASASHLEPDQSSTIAPDAALAAPESSVQSETDAKTEAKIDSEAKVEPTAKAQPQSEVKVESEVQATAESETKPHSETIHEAETKTNVEAKTEIETERKAETEHEAQISGAKVTSQSESDLQSDSGNKEKGQEACLQSGFAGLVPVSDSSSSSAPAQAQLQSEVQDKATAQGPTQVKPQGQVQWEKFQGQGNLLDDQSLQQWAQAGVSESNEQLPSLLAEIVYWQVAYSITHDLTRDDFMVLLSELFKAQGAASMILPRHQGQLPEVDLLVSEGALGFGGDKVLVKLKYDDAPVTEDFLAQLEGLIQTYGADKAIVITPASFVCDFDATLNSQLECWDMRHVARKLVELHSQFGLHAQRLLPLRALLKLVMES